MALMPNEPPPPVSLEVSSEFKRNLRVLAKRYRSIRSDLEPVLAQLQAGECPGDQIAGIDYTVFKVRVRNRDAQRGKSGGYRVIYYSRTKTTVTLITIYSKSDQGDVSNSKIRQIIESHPSQ
jgi:mRNA-degrading endonuclease RelE of RelBE toxin-antitoxin system